MKLTKNYKFKKPEPSDFIDVETDFHETLDTVDAELKKHADTLAGLKKTWRVALPVAAWTATFPYSQTVTVPDSTWMQKEGLPSREIPTVPDSMWMSRRESPYR